jgi:hypothetical protein
MLVVKVTVAAPLPFVVLFGDENEPPAAELHVTVRPGVLTGLLFASTSWAVIVTPVPATGLLLLEVTRYFAAPPIAVVIVPLVPVKLFASVPVTVCTVPTTV